MMKTNPYYQDETKKELIKAKEKILIKEFQDEVSYRHGRPVITPAMAAKMPCPFFKDNPVKGLSLTLYRINEQTRRRCNG